MHSSMNIRPLKAKINKPDNIIKIKVGASIKYRCAECGNELSRRFNADRHYKRFHKIIQTRTCCNKTFYTKCDYYDHKKFVHNEVKRYGRAWKHETQPTSSNWNTKAIYKRKDSALKVTSKTSISAKTKESTLEKIKEDGRARKHETQVSSSDFSIKRPEIITPEKSTKSPHYIKDNATDSKSINREESKPTKIFIFRMETQNRIPLQNIENYTKKSLKTLRRNALQNVKIISSANKKSFIYDCTAASVSDLMQLMNNTICNAF